MKLKSLFYLFSATTLMSGMLFSCSDDNSMPDENSSRVVLDFENCGRYAAEDAGALNYYADQPKFVQVTGVLSMNNGVLFSLPIQGEAPFNYYSGGTVVSDYNYMSDKSYGVEKGFWYSYKNQASVYNTSSVDGTNKNAGAGGSHYFGVVFMSADEPQIYLKSVAGNPVECMVKSIAICPTSYLYGVIMNGNQFSKPIDKSGFFAVTVTGYDKSGNETGSQKITIISHGNGNDVNIATRWKVYDLSKLGKVASLKFSATGSDSGQYGLNTPKYIAIDNVVFDKIMPEKMMAH